MAGSPPRVRGKAPAQLHEKLKGGITPACAGKSAAKQTSTVRCGDHPRVCGEKTSCLCRRLWRAGSPPRVLGKVLQLICTIDDLGITPACAGKSCSPFRPRGLSWDHPRVCGEKFVGFSNTSSCAGSPPRVRGKGESPEKGENGLRITPACAGKSAVSHAFFQQRQDHPRVCGEKLLHPPRFRPTWGSPPRVRGKANAFVDQLDQLGITPACAGKSRALFYGRTGNRDHPRVCGEKQMLSFSFASMLGSPPRVRGKVCRYRQHGLDVRITPACAGKRAAASGATARAKDHPRVCGEKLANLAANKPMKGSPPRVRGKENIPNRSFYSIGITPACAGKRLKKALKNKDF